jgi:MFS family permease
MLAVLLLIATSVACWYAYKRTVTHGLIEINHVTTFTFGFLFYWIFPIVIGLYGPRLGSKLAVAFSVLFDKRFVTPYIAACLGLYLCFLAGDSVGIRLFPHKKAMAGAKIPKLAFSFVAVAASVLTVYTWFALRAQLLLPYGTRITFNPARGTLSSSILLLGVVALMFTIDRPEIPWRRRLVSPYFLGFMAGAVVLLFLGSRLYIASFFLMFVIYQSSLRRQWRLRTLLTGAFVFVLLLGLLGVWRAHEEITEAAPEILREPILTSLSLVHHLRYGKIAYINSPVYLMSDFANLIPALIAPDKASLLKRPRVYTPLGGTHSFVSFNLNFGVLGTGVFWLLLPIAFRYLKARSSSTLLATMYIMCSAWMAFTFFRDPFSISLVKAIFQYSILIPIGVVVLGRLLSSACLPAGNSALQAGEPQVEGP